MSSPLRRRDAEFSESKPENAEVAEVTVRYPAPREDQLTKLIIGAAIEVHRHLGPGLMESTYEECLCYELSQAGLAFTRQVQLPVSYKGIKLDCGYRLDIVVEGTIIVELKTIEELLPIHTAQLLTYLKVSGKEVGLLINFNEPVLKKGLKRVVNRFSAPGEDPFTSAASANSGLKNSASRRLGGE